MDLNIWFRDLPSHSNTFYSPTALCGRDPKFTFFAFRQKLSATHPRAIACPCRCSVARCQKSHMTLTSILRRPESTCLSWECTKNTTACSMSITCGTGQEKHLFTCLPEQLVYRAPIDRGVTLRLLVCNRPWFVFCYWEALPLGALLSSDNSWVLRCIR